jgi:hypothetical protein
MNTQRNKDIDSQPLVNDIDKKLAVENDKLTETSGASEYIAPNTGKDVINKNPADTESDRREALNAKQASALAFQQMDADLEEAQRVNSKKTGCLPSLWGMLFSTKSKKSTLASLDYVKHNDDPISTKKLNQQ